jgi:hypothetical protein
MIKEVQHSVLEGCSRWKRTAWKISKRVTLILDAVDLLQNLKDAVSPRTRISLFPNPSEHLAKPDEALVLDMS